MEIDLGLGLLDHQILDSEGRRCGNVDDLELTGVRDGEPRVVAILAGPGAWKGRGFFGRIMAALAGGGMVRTPWEEVVEVKPTIRLRKRAEELGLGSGDDRMRPWIEKIPGSQL
jgi:sporulation protein YlmC with PRC-barrel domain